MDSSTPGFPVLQHLLELPKLMCFESVMPSNHLILRGPLLLLPSIFPSIRFFSKSQLFASGGQSIRPSASVLLMNIQDWFPLGMTGLISLQSKGLSRVFSNITKSSNSLMLRLLYGPTLKSIHDYWENQSFDYTDLCQQSNFSVFQYATKTNMYSVCFSCLTMRKQEYRQLTASIGHRHAPSIYPLLGCTHGCPE